MSVNKSITLHMDNERKQGEGTGQPKGAGDTSQHDTIVTNGHGHDGSRTHTGQFAPCAVKPSERDERAAEYLLRGDGPTDALRRAGFPESRAKRGMAEIARHKSLKIALLNRICRMKDIPLPSAEDRANIVRAQLLTNLALGAPKGSNNAARLLGLDREVNMFVSDVQQGNINLIAPQGQFNFNATGASEPVHNEGARKQLMSEDIPDDIAG